MRTLRVKALQARVMVDQIQVTPNRAQALLLAVGLTAAWLGMR